MRKVLTALLLVLLVQGSAEARLKTLGKGDNMRFDPSDIPPAMQEAFKVMEVKCIKCHTMERTVVAITTGIAPISGLPFDRKATKAYGIKMLRKPDSNMNKQEVKTVVDLMNFLLDEAAR